MVMKTLLNILYISVSPGIIFPLYLPLPWHILGAYIISLCAPRPRLHSENHKADKVSSFEAITFHYNT